MTGEKPVANPERQPKTYKIPSRSWGITASEAGDILVAAKEIGKNKPLNKAALADLRERKKTLAKIV